MANTVKVTKRDRYAELRVLAENAGKDELIMFIDHEVELLDKKSANKSATKTQKENEGVKDEILGVMNADKAMSVGDIMTALDGKYTNQKISALLRQLREAGEVVRTEVKGKAYFALAEVESEE